MFEYRDLGRVALKGLANPVEAWQPQHCGKPLRGAARDQLD